MLANSLKGVSRAGVLFGLGTVVVLGSLAPIWVLNQRNEQRSLMCQFNQTRIVEAFHRYDEEVGHFPGYREYRFGRPIGDDDSAESGDSSELVSWAFPLLPHLYGQSKPDEADPRPAWHAFYEMYGPLAEGENRKVPAVGRIGVFLCPEDPQRDGPAPLTMIANAGQPDRRQDPADSRKNGLLMDAAGRMPSWSMGQLTEADGISHTILLSENIDAGNWNDDTEAKFSLLWRPPTGKSDDDAQDDDVATPLFINERVGESVDSQKSLVLFARPSAYHRWGVNVTFADGANRVLTPSIDPQTYLQLLRPMDATAP